MTGLVQAVKALEVTPYLGSSMSCHLAKHVLYSAFCPIVQEAEVTNAGLGSNLTLEGSVEADASVMLGDKTFAAVGAAPGLHKQLALPVEHDGCVLLLARHANHSH